MAAELGEHSGEFFRVKAKPTQVKFIPSRMPTRPPPPTNPPPRSPVGGSRFHQGLGRIAAGIKSTKDKFSV